MRKTLTSILLLALWMICSLNTLGQRPFIPEETFQGCTQNQSQNTQNQIGDSVLSQLRALLGDDVAQGIQTRPQNYSNSTPQNYSNSTPQNYSNSTPQNYSDPNDSSNNSSTFSNSSAQPRVIVYPKIKATVGSEIIVEPAQGIGYTESQQGMPSQPQDQDTPQTTVSSAMDKNPYTEDNLYGSHNGYIPPEAASKTPKVSELYTIVDGDTVSVILPQKNWGRFDRGLYNYLYIPKGRWAFGLTASYGEFNTEDVQLLNILKDFDVKGKLYSIKPFITYFFRNNQSMGMRLNYTRGEADLRSMVFDFDDDMSFDLKDVSYYYEGYSMSVFYRNYVGLDRNSRFSVFNDIDLSFSSGSSRFKRYYDQVIRDTQTTSMGVALNFSPGVCVFIMDNAAFNVSFGVFGLSMHRQKQITDGIEEGSCFSSGANFKFNLFNINFGLMIVI